MLFDQRTTITEVIEVFIASKRAENVAGGTLDFYRQKLGSFNKYSLTQNITQLTQITPLTIREYLLFLRERGNNEGGIHAHFRSLKTFLRWYEKEFEPEDWRNPINRIKAPRTVLEPLKPIPFEDLEKMIRTCSNNLIGRRDKAIMLFLLDTGVRASELLDIQLSEIDTLSGQVFIRLGKGRKSRYVYLGERSRKTLRQYLKLRTDNNKALWITDEGDPLTYWGLVSKMKRLAAKAGVPAPSLHSFRYAFALAALRNGMDVFSLQKAGGWASMSVMRRYLKQTETDIEVAMKKFSPVDNME